MRIFVNVLLVALMLLIASCFVSPATVGAFVIESIEKSIVGFFQGFEHLFLLSADNPMVTIPVVTIVLSVALSGDLEVKIAWNFGYVKYVSVIGEKSTWVRKSREFWQCYNAEGVTTEDGRNVVWDGLGSYDGYFEVP